MKLCFSTLGCPGWTLNQIAGYGAGYGFDGVELRLHPDGRHVDTSFDAQKRADTRNLFAAHGLAIAALSGYTQFNSDDTDVLLDNGETLLRSARLAADLNAPYLRTFIGQGGLSGKGAEILRRYCDKALELGVAVLAEIHAGTGLPTGGEAAVLLKTVDSAGLNILWDIHHSLTGNESLEDTWNAVGPRIRHVHAKDACPANHPCLPGKGALPLKDAVGLLKRAGYGGYLSFEWEKTWLPDLEEPEIALPLYVEYITNILKEASYGKHF
ncbi:MAG: sugar phosphate isomerase/epimerase [Defluviitaleaceae bacterium]|nr:sugar phosphate isomerase/epimerase [Defluviitaleaceae bacterium]